MRRRVVAAMLSWRLDAVVVVGIALLGYGAGEFHPGFAPIVWGLGLIAAVRWGAA